MRMACLEDETMADYLENCLTDEERSQAEQHLSGCDICLEKLVVASSLTKGAAQCDIEPVPAEVTEAAVRLVQEKIAAPHPASPDKLGQYIRRLFQGVSCFFQLDGPARLQLQPVRSSVGIQEKDTSTARTTLEDIDAEIEIERVSANKCNIRVTFPENKELEQCVRVTLKRGERELLSFSSNGDALLFDNIRPGRYELAFSRKGVRFGSHPFEIKELH